MRIANHASRWAALEASAAALDAGGALLVHDLFTPAYSTAAPESVLGTLGRHVTRGGCRAWSVRRLESALGPLGLGPIRTFAIPGSSTLVVAEKQ